MVRNRYGLYGEWARRDEAMVDIERYLNIRSAYGASFTAHDALVFLMDTTGVPQVWSVDEPGAWPDQLTFSEERVTFVAPSPTRREVIFGMDQGGNEREQFYRLDGESGQITDMTRSPAAKHLWGRWDSQGNRFAFASNRRDEAVFDIYVQGRADRGDDADLLHTGDGWWTVGEWSPDDSELILTEAHSNYDQDLYTLDVASHNLRHITPHEGDVRYASAQWAPDGDGIFLTTDADADTRYLASLDLTSDTIAEVESGGDWNIEEVTVHEATGRIAYTRNVEGYTELTIGQLVDDTTIDAFPQPALPKCVAGGLEFSADGDRLAVTVTGRTRNTNVYVVAAETGQASQWTQASTAGIPGDTFIEPDVIHFTSFDNRSIPGLLSLPHATGPVPVIVDIHGGPESQRRPSFAPVTQYFLANGYAVFEPNVRGSTGYGKAYNRLDDKRNRMDAVADLKAGVEWLRRRDTIDPDRIIALGASYGGFMVLAALTEYPELWAAGVDIVGIANFVTFLENTGDWRRELREAEYGSLAADREFLESISPLTNIDRITAPLLVLHGANDPRVPVGEAEQIAEKAAVHVPTEKLIFDDEGHGFSKLENRITAYRKIIAFLDEHL